MELEMLFICDSVVSEDGEMRLKNIGNEFEVTQLPIKRSFSVVARSRFRLSEYGNHKYNLTFSSPSGVQLFEVTNSFNIHSPREEEYACHTQVFPMPNFEFDEAGTYQFTFTIDDRAFYLPMMVYKMNELTRSNFRGSPG